MACRKWSTPHERVLPWEGGWSDWPLLESKQWEWLEELFEEMKSAKELRETLMARGKEQAQGFYGNVSRD